jgi:hypothetical protein
MDFHGFYGAKPMHTIATQPTEFYKPDPSNPREGFPGADLRLLGESLKKRNNLFLCAPVH